MAYKPILAPEEFHAWLKRRADRLDTSMADCLREIPGIVDETEIAPSASASPALLSATERACAVGCASERGALAGRDGNGAAVGNGS